MKQKRESAMKQEESKMMLTAAARAEAQRAHSAAVADFLAPERLLANVVGLGVGVKWKNGQPTGEPALVVLVTHKVAKEQLSAADLVPPKLADMQTDVLAIGYPIAGGGEPMEAGAQSLTKRIRPAKGGYSVGNAADERTGTIATCVYEPLPGASSRTPAHGIGMPRRYYILSNNHVLAGCNQRWPGCPIVQPGRFDGGSDPEDRIATLSLFEFISFEPPTPRERHKNLVDAAIAEGEFHDLDREIYWIGYVRGWRQKANVTEGTVVQKTGRTTNYTIGRITVIDATVDVLYRGVGVARFMEQIVTTKMADFGDSGSLVTTLDNVAVGLLFAGGIFRGAGATIVNHIENVRSQMWVEVAEQIL